MNSVIKQNKIGHISEYVYLGGLNKMERGLKDEIDGRIPAERKSLWKHGNI